jgi:hypothetical protein
LTNQHSETALLAAIIEMTYPWQAHSDAALLVSGPWYKLRHHSGKGTRDMGELVFIANLMLKFMAYLLSQTTV